jgi:hypothetical protein
LTDFLCAGYPLPSDCSFLNNELTVILDEYVQRKNKQRIVDVVWYEKFMDFVMGGLRVLMPKTILHFIAYFLCFTASRPECTVSIIYGKELDGEPEGDEGHDEL